MATNASKMNSLKQISLKKPTVSIPGDRDCFWASKSCAHEQDTCDVKIYPIISVYLRILVQR